MEKFSIQHKRGYDYITSIEYHFTLRVVPPEKRGEDTDYPPYQAVAAVFERTEPAVIPAWVLDPEAEFPSDWSWGETDGYDFEGIDCSFSDDDVPNSNKQLWLDTINYYCQLKLDKAVVDLRPYNYNYELSELNCEPETLMLLNGEITFDEYQLLKGNKSA